MTERGYSKRLHADPDATRGCECPEDFDHDGKCQNALREKKAYKCQPCSMGWHLPWSCSRFVEKDRLTLSTVCRLCGWDSSEHPIPDSQRRLMVDEKKRHELRGPDYAGPTGNT